jgi:hypothetical protein
MTLSHLPDGGLRASAVEGRLTFARTVQRLRAAFRTIHRAIVAAKLRPSEPAFQADGYDGPGSDEDAARYPQQPRILGDKWDF